MGFKSITPALHHSIAPISPFVWQLILFRSVLRPVGAGRTLADQFFISTVQ